MHMTQAKGIAPPVSAPLVGEEVPSVRLVDGYIRGYLPGALRTRGMIGEVRVV